MRLRSLAALCFALASLPLQAADKATAQLALGDSVPFGFNPLLPLPSPAAKFIGYPEIIARFAFPLSNLANLACPGQTSASFLVATAPEPSKNCAQWRQAGLPLHANYAWPVSQMQAALDQLKAGNKVKLVTLMIGGDDLILLAETCNAVPACIQASLPGTLQAYAGNLAAILTQIRAVYKGDLVLVTYYSTDYTDQLTTGAIAALNSAATAVAHNFGVKIADGFGSFGLFASIKGGKTCATGLLFQTSPGVCDEHPSVEGQAVLAAAVAAAH